MIEHNARQHAASRDSSCSRSCDLIVPASASACKRSGINWCRRAKSVVDRSRKAELEQEEHARRWQMYRRCWDAPHNIIQRVSVRVGRGGSVRIVFSKDAHILHNQFQRCESRDARSTRKGNALSTVRATDPRKRLFPCTIQDYVRRKLNLVNPFAWVGAKVVIRNHRKQWLAQRQPVRTTPRAPASRLTCPAVNDPTEEECAYKCDRDQP